MESDDDYNDGKICRHCEDPPAGGDEAISQLSVIASEARQSHDFVRRFVGLLREYPRNDDIVRLPRLFGDRNDKRFY